MPKYYCYDIIWDTDDIIIDDLPDTYTVELEPTENEDDIADILSDIFGWCVFSFKCKEA